jgi:hypothetical protein
MPLTPCFQCVACGLWIAVTQISAGGMAEHYDDNHDLENREIIAADTHGIYPKWAYGGGAGHGVEEAF